MSQLLKWGLKKNVGSKEMANIVRIQQKRKAQYDKDTNFTVRGRHVSQDNIDRWQKRQKVDEQPQTGEMAQNCPLSRVPELTFSS